ncbi:Murein DD-endopeptidase MepM and murein hydrolase activator NlpD, contain LysM domain [Alkalibacterium putridalgicola]|uniref:Murein DD-endopeptidase MepM and murein hydrolase activator NlpD, contain LysM domain n=1 Tax=Alkalibacterium putridalgicola TaxID=426703 RepID=A0A1H7XS85_9LACT|nr:peptidoglycan DD-metalloendopeptidase family protein [Alkalibacterium putridalgicola]GEK90347.1 hypothetical protein APU01nite_23860 [Alkalibacterium putridalgicola]SEM36018.1 Murein DD-endopeptidase MepM and murein hydrolase activator NlpD, contain LysM domain [Alkalibacterium putridalgicola]
MKKKLIVGLVSSMLLTTAAPMLDSVVQAEESLEELQKEKEKIENRSEELGSVIEETESEMNSLELERQELEANIQSLQITIQELTEDVEKQEGLLSEKNKEIDKLNEEIANLTEAIELRNEKLMTQARATQTKWNPTNIIHMIISAEDISDLISRMGVITTLVSANQTVIEDQRRDQEALVEAESKVQLEKEQAETLLAEVKANREELTVQQAELDDEIMYVAERYQMNSAEKDQFVSEQFELAQETMALNADIKAEEERIAEEKRLEEERIAEEKRQEALRIAEEKRLEEERIAREKREEEERIAREERLAEEKAKEEAAKAAAEEEAAVLAAQKRKEEAAQKDQAEKEASERAAAERRREEQRQEEEAAAQVRAEEKARAEERAREKARAEERAREKARAEAQAEAERKAAAAAKAQQEKEQAQASTSSNSGWLRPASGYFSSSYGYRTHPVTGARGSFHNGLDIAGGGPIRATRAGTVAAASYSGTYGYRVIIDHGDGYRTLYAHMQPGLNVSVGQRVSQGQQLGIMGTTGRSTGVHLHFIVYKNGRTVNPIDYIR